MPCLPLHFLRGLNAKTKRVARRKGSAHSRHPASALIFSPHHYAAMTLSASLQVSPRVSTSRSSACSPLSPPPRSSMAAPVGPQLNLMDLPDDVLQHVMRCLMQPEVTPLSEGDAPGVQIATLRDVLPVAYTCKRMHQLLHASMENVCLWSQTLTDSALESFVVNAGGALRRFVVRACTSLTDDGILSLVQCAPHLRSLDLSFVSAVTDTSVIAVCTSLSSSLRKLLLRKCVQLTDKSMKAISMCSLLEVADISYCVDVTDEGVVEMVEGCGSSLKLLSMSNCKLLSDTTLMAIGTYCRRLEQVCARGLPRITDDGFELLCRGIGWRVDGIDVLDCVSLTRDPVLCALREYCPRIASSIERETEAKTLRQILVTTLRANIFIVHGCDPKSGRDTIHMVLLDNGDIHSANILSAGTTDLSLLGVVLCKSYGSSLDEATKHMLTRNYGILPSMLAE